MRIGSVSKTSDPSCAAEYNRDGFQVEDVDANKPHYTSAEAVSYDLPVTEENAMLTIKYLFSGCKPGCEPGGDHLVNGAATPPGFKIVVYQPKDAQGKWEKVVDCGSKPMDICTIDQTATCRRSSDYWGDYSRTALHSDWETAVYDLSAYIGKTVRIFLATHDCVWNGTSNGGHFAYLYFTARTEPLRLKLKYCKSDQPFTAEAPEDMDTYTWYGYSSTSKSWVQKGSSSNSSNILTGPANEYLGFDSLKCEMTKGGMSCKLVVKSLFKPSNMEPHIVPELGCNMTTLLKDSTVLADKVHDKVAYREWYVLSKTYNDYTTTMLMGDLEGGNLNGSVEEGIRSGTIGRGEYTVLDTARIVKYNFPDDEGRWVRLYVQNVSGCDTFIYMFVKPNPVLKWNKAEKMFCEGAPVELLFVADEEYNNIKTYRVPNPNYYYWTEELSKLSSTLKYEVVNSKGETIEAITGTPVEILDSASNKYPRYPVTVIDMFGCKETGVYPIEVVSRPDLTLSPSNEGQKGFISKDVKDGYTTYYVCPGTILNITGSSVTGSKFMFSTQDADSEGTLSDGEYVATPEELGFGTYYLQVKTTDKLACSARKYFGISYKEDTVKHVVPDAVCPNEKVLVSVVNNKYAANWWTTKEGAADLLEPHTGNDYTITNPNATNTYHYSATDMDGCLYEHSFQLNVLPTKNNSYQFTNLLGDNVGFEMEKNSEHTYIINKLCSDERLNITAEINHDVFRADHEYKTDYDNAWFKVQNDADGYHATVSGLVPREVKAYKVIWKTVPYDNAGNPMCTVLDTFVIQCHKDILSRITMVKKGSTNLQKNAFNFCDNDEIEIAANAYYNGNEPSDEETAKFEIKWTDDLADHIGGNVFEIGSVINKDYASQTDDKGNFYNYAYTIKSIDGGCTKDFVVPVYVNPDPEFNLEAKPEFVCEGGNQTVSAIDLNAGGSFKEYGNPTVYKWSFPDPKVEGAVKEVSASTNSITYTGVDGEKELTIKGTTIKGCSVDNKVNLSSVVKPDPDYKLMDVDGRTELTQVCAGAQYKLLVFDRHASEYAISTCGNIITGKVTRKNAPYNDVVWSESVTGTSTSVSNRELTCELAADGSLFGEYTAMAFAGNESFTVTVTSPCGCVMSIPVTVPVVSAPKVSIERTNSRADFLCPDDEAVLTINYTGTGNNLKYGWTTSLTEPDKAGEIDVNKMDANLKVYTFSHEPDADFVYYTGHVFDGQCYGAASIKVYNHSALDFEVEAVPDKLCENGATRVVLTAKSDEKGADGASFYLQNKDLSWGIAWESNVKEISDLSKYLINGANNERQIVVRSGIARYAKSGDIRTTNKNYFCYNNKPVNIAVQGAPSIGYKVIANKGVLANTIGDGVSVTDKVLCPRDEYSIEVQNKKYVDGVRDVITITDLDNPARTFTKEVNAGMKATFNGLVAGSDIQRDRWTVNITPKNTTCGVDEQFNVEIAPFPEITIDQEGGWYEGDTLLYCLNYFQITQEATAIKKSSIKNNGVDLSANIGNYIDKYAPYTYLWSSSGNMELHNDYATPSINAQVIATTDRTGYTHDGSFTLQVTDKNGCKSDAATVNIKTHDAPRFGVNSDNPNGGTTGTTYFKNGCKNSDTPLNVYEGRKNIRISEADFPNYTYNAYYLGDDAKPDDYNKLADEKLLTSDMQVTPGFGNWITYRTNGKGTLKNKDGVIVADSCTQYDMRKEVIFHLGENTQYLYTITKTDNNNCTAYATINYNPHYYIDPANFYFDINVNPGGDQTKTVRKHKYISLSDITPDGSDTLARVCPGDFMVFNFADKTTYNKEPYGLNNPWNWDSKYYVDVEFDRIGTNSGGWYECSDTTNGRLCATTRTITGPTRVRIKVRQNSQNADACYYTSPYFWITNGDSPQLANIYGDDACYRDDKGELDGVVKFRATSNAPEGTEDKHHYSWWSADNKTQIVSGQDGYTISGKYGEFLTYESHFSEQDFGTAYNKPIQVYLRDEVDGYCRSADVQLTRYVWRNPEFKISVDRDVVCEGDEVNFTVTQDYSVARNIWQYYINENVTSTTSKYSMYNDNSLRVTGGTSQEKSFPHYYDAKFKVVEPYDTFWVSSFINTGRVMTFQPTAGANVNLYCYTHKPYVVHALRKPKPLVELFSSVKQGNYEQDESIMRAKSDFTDSVGTRMMCPDAEYFRQFSNQAPDTLKNYTQSSTTYFIKDNITETDFVNSYTSRSDVVYTENLVPALTANGHSFSMYATTSNGCTSDTFSFQPPVGKIPTVRINKPFSGVCAGDDGAEMQLNASAQNGAPFKYQWFTGIIGPQYAINKTAEENQNSQLVEPNASGSASFVLDYVDYHVQVTNHDGCIGEGSTRVFKYPKPQFTATLLSENPCVNSDIQIELKKDNDINYPTEPFNYTWNDAKLTPIGVSTDAVTTNMTIEKRQELSFLASVINNGVTCTSEKKVVVETTGIPEPQAKLLVQSEAGVFETADNGVKVCPGTQYKIVFHNAAKGSTCDPDIYTLINTSTGDEEEFSSGVGLDYTTNAITATATTNYQFYLKSGCDCVSPRGALSIEVVANPKVEIAGPKNFCAGQNEEITLTATAGAETSTMKSWEWTQCPTADNTARVQSFRPEQKATYAVTGINQYGCKASASFTIEPLQVPNLIIETENKPVCEGSTVTLKAVNTNAESKARLYNWTDGVTTWTGETISPVITANTTFTVTAIEDNSLSCKSKPVDVEVKVAAIPNIVVTTYQVMENGNSVFNPETTPICPNTSFYPVFQNKTGDPKVCNTETYKFWILGTEDTIVVPDVVSNSLANQDGYKFKMGSKPLNIQYKVVTDCGCPSTVGQFTVTPADIPVVTLSAPDHYCGNTTPDVTLTASSAATIEKWVWSSNVTAPDAGSEVTVQPNGARSEYSVYGISKVGCKSAEATKVITPFEIPTVTLKAPEYVCVNDIAGVKAEIEMPEGVEIANTVWTPAEARRFAEDSVYMNISGQTTFKVEVNDENGCKVISDEITIGNYLTPKVNLVVKRLDNAGVVDINGKEKLCAGTAFYPTFENTAIGDNKTFCATDTIILTCINTGEVIKMYGNNGTIINNTGADRKSFTMGEENMRFLYQLRTSCGCASDVEDFVVYKADAPVIRINASANDFCDGENNEITVTATTGNANDDQNMTWSWDIPNQTPNSAMQTFVPSATTTYHVTATSSASCEGTASITITKKAMPKLLVSSDKNTVCYGDLVTLTAVNTNEAEAPLGSVSWTSAPDAKLYNLSGMNPTFESKGTATFTATAMAANGCMATSNSVTVKTAETPNPVVTIFRNNGDKITDLDAVKLCPGEVYWAEFTNTTGGNGCSTDKFTVTSVDGAYSNDFQVTGGGIANNGGSVQKYQMGESTQVFNYKVETACGCVSDVKSFTVNVAEIPVVKIMGKNTFCSNVENPNIVLTASSSNEIKTYEWNTEVSEDQRGNAQVTVNPIANTEYQVTVTSTDGCVSSSPIFTVTAKPAPVVSLLTDDKVCLGSKVEVKANVALKEGVKLLNIEWKQPSRGFTIVDDLTISAVINAATDFEVTANADNGCSATSEVVTVAPIERPVATVELRRKDNKAPFDPATDFLCAGTEYYPVFKLEGDPTATSQCMRDTFFLRYGSVIDTFVANHGSNANANAAKFYTVDGNATFFYDMKTSCGCESNASQSYSIQEADAPFISFATENLHGNENNAYCYGSTDEVSITVSSNVIGTTFEWTSPANLNNTTDPTVTVVPSTAPYTVVGTTPNGCTSTRTFQMVEMAKPTVMITGAEQVCEGAEVTLTASSPEGNSYIWAHGANTAVVKVKVNETKTFSVTAYTADGCPSDPYDFTVNVNANPTITFHYSDPLNSGVVCDGDAVTIEAVAQNSNTKFTWYADALRQNELTVGGNVTHINNQAITVKPITNSQTYYYVTAESDGCTGKGNAVVKANVLPKFQFKGVTTYCEREDLELSIANADAERYDGVSFKWNGGNVSQTVFKEQNLTAAEKPYTYTVMATDKYGCSYEDSVKVKVNPSPNITIDPVAAAVCPNDRATLTASGADSYTWTRKEDITDRLSSSATFISPAITELTEFRVVGKSTNSGCFDSAFVTVNVKRAPVLELKTAVVDGKVMTCQGSETTLLVKGADSYTWSANVMSSNGPAAVVNPTYETVYKVTGEIDGCTTDMSITVDPQSSPVVELDVPEGVCYNTLLEMTAIVNGSRAMVPGMEYAWADDKSETSNVHSLTLTSSADFAVTVTEVATGCSTKVSKPVTSYPQPNVVIKSDLDIVCPGMSNQMVANASRGTSPYTYNWVRGNNHENYTGNLINPRIDVRKFVIDGKDSSIYLDTFSVTVTDYHGCVSSTAEKAISIQKVPEIKNLASTFFCQSDNGRDSIYISLTGASEYQYEGMTTWTSNPDTVLYYAIPKQYTNHVIGREPLKNSNGLYCETKRLDITSEIGKKPVLQMYIADRNDDGVCAGDPVKLHVESSIKNDVTYSWELDSENNTADYTHATLTRPETFTCRVRTNGEKGCESTVSKRVEVYEIPNLKWGTFATPVCEGSSTWMSVSASSATATTFSYEWSRSSVPGWKGADANSQSVGSIVDGEKFTVVVTDKTHNCKSRPIENIMYVQPIPVIKNLAKTTWCVGDSIKLVLDGATEYFFENVKLSGNDTTLAPVMGEPVVYYHVYGQSPRDNSHDVSGRNQYCVSKKIEITETIVAAPKVEIISEKDGACEGESITLTANVPNYVGADVDKLTYNWVGFSEKGNQLTFKPDDNRTIVVQVSDSKTECTVAAEKFVNHWSNPTADILLPTGSLACQGEQIVLFANVQPAGDYTFEWTAKNSGETYYRQEIMPYIENREEFTLVAKDRNGCYDHYTKPVTIDVQARPVVKIQAPENICKDEVATLTMSGAQQYWVNERELVDANGLFVNTYSEKLSNPNTYNFYVKGADKIVYNFEGEEGYTYCRSKDATSVAVKVNDKPTLVVSGEKTICEGSRLNLTLSGADSYDWDNVIDDDPADNVLSLIPNGNIDGHYTYSVTGKYTQESTCSSQMTIDVFTLKSPVFTIESSAKGVCTDETVTLTAKPVEGSQNTEKWSYTWSGGQINGTTGQTVTPVVTRGNGTAGSASNVFSAIAKNEIGCFSKPVVAEIQLFPVPVLELTASRMTDNWNNSEVVDPNVQIQLCEGDKIRLFARPTNDVIVTNWMWDNKEEENNQFYFPADNNPNVNLYYHNVVGSTVNGCKATASATVAIAKAPQIGLASGGVNGDHACQSTLLEPEDIVLRPSGADYYIWPDYGNERTEEGEEFTVPADKLGDNTFKVYGYNKSFKCPGTNSITIKVYPRPAVQVDNSNAFVCQGDEATLIAVPDNFKSEYTYLWDGARSVDPNGTSAHYTSGSFVGTRVVDLVVTDEKQGGCTATLHPEIVYSAKPTISVAGGAERKFCRGSELRLIGEGANSYSWIVDGQEVGTRLNNEEFVITPKDGQKISLVGKNSYVNPLTLEEYSCVSNEEEIKLMFMNAPSLIIEGKDTICYGEPVKLAATGIDFNETGDFTPGYVWNDKKVGDTFEEEFSSTNGSDVIYKVEATSANGCKTVKTKKVNMRPKTVINLRYPSTVCEESVAWAIASSDAKILSYRWSTNEIGDSTGMVINKDNAPTGKVTYTVVATDANNCVSDASATISMKDKLVLTDRTKGVKDENGAYVVCSGNMLSLVVEGGFTHMWNKDPELNTPYITRTFTSDANYTVEAWDDVCHASLTIPVHVQAAPTILIEGATPVCMGESVTLKPYSDTENLKFTWSTNAENVQDGESLTVTPRQTSTVYLTGEETLSKCKATTNVEIVVNNLPRLEVDGDLNPCENSYTNLTGTGAMHYTWTVNGEERNGESFSTLIGNEPITVSLYGVDENNCHNTISRTLTPVAKPEFEIDGNLTVCEGENLQLRAVNTATACTYVWNETDTANIFNKKMDKNGTQTVYVRGYLSNKDNCYTEKSATVIVNELPVLYLTGDDYPCQHTTMAVTAHGAEQYKWSGMDIVTADEAEYTREVISKSEFNASLSGWKNGCRKDTVFTFKVHPAPLVTISSDMEQTCKNGIVRLTATSPTATTFDWGADGAGAVITPTVTERKKFIVTVYDEFGCKGTDDKTIDLIEDVDLTIDVTAGDNKEFVEEDGILIYKACENASFIFTAHGPNEFAWADGLNTSDQPAYAIENATSNHKITVTGTLGNCVATKDIKIEILRNPSIWIDGSMNVCEGEKVHLVANGADDYYEWSAINQNYVSGDKSEVLDAPVLYQPVNAKLTGWGKNGCKTELPVELTYTPAPKLNVAAVENVCIGEPVDMTILNPEADIVYVWNDNFSGETFTYRSTEVGVDSVLVEARTNGLDGCKTAKKFGIKTRALPTITYMASGKYAEVQSDSSITNCAGSALTITPLGCKDWIWTFDGRDTVIKSNGGIFAPENSTVYTITGTDDYGCLNKRDVVVNTIAAPTIYSPTYGPANENGQIEVKVCRNESVMLDVTGADEYVWAVDKSTDNVLEVSPKMTRTYIVNGTILTNNCPATAVFNVVVNELPTITVANDQGKEGNKLTLCRDTEFKLTATGAEHYIWTDDSGAEVSYADSYVDYAGQSASYTVEGTDANGCVGKRTYLVSAVDVPNVYCEPAEPQLCAGVKTTLKGRNDGGNGFAWLNAAGDTLTDRNSLEIVPSADVTYTLVGWNLQGCKKEVSVPVTVYSAPSIWVDGYDVDENGVSETVKVCKYQDLTLTAMGNANSYEWSNKSTDNAITIENASISQTYLLTGTGANNCKTTIQIPVEVRPTAVITVKGDQYVCYGQSTTLNAEAGPDDYDNFTWSNNKIGADNQVYVFTDTVFTVTGFNSTSGCSYEAPFSIKVKELPKLSYTADGGTDVCQGSNLIIRAEGANTYVWHDGTEGDKHSSVPMSNDIYKVTGTLNGCSDELSIPVTVKAAPAIWADGLKPICKGETLSLTAKGAETYEWSGNIRTAEFTAKPLDNTSYTLKGTAKNGCEAEIEVPVIVRELPVVTYDGATSVCLNSTTEIKAVVSSETTEPDGKGNKYRWYMNNDPEPVSTQGVLRHLVTEDKVEFRLVGIDPSNCQNEVKIAVVSRPTPKVSFEGPKAICNGDAGVFYATGAKDYKWIAGADTIEGNVFNAKPATDTYYKLIGTSALECSADTSFLLVINQKPEVSVSGNTEVCRGEALDLVGAGAETYKWSNGSTDEHFQAVPVASSDYTLTGTDANGCSSTVKFAVTVNELPEFLVRAKSEGVCEGLTDTLYADNSDKVGEYTYFWSAADGTSISGDTIAPVIAKNTTFTVTANNNATHCQSSVEKTIYAYMKPTIGFLGKDSVCSGGNLTITATGADSYEWESNGQVVSTTPTFSIMEAKQSMQLYVTGKLANCSAREVYSIQVVPTPRPTIAEIDGKDYACRGSEVSLLGACFTDKDKGLYKWSANGDTVKTESAVATQLTDLPKRTTSYSLTAINNFGCVGTVTKVISIQELPTVGISVDKRYVCPNQEDSVKFTAKKTGKAALAWNWQSRPGQDDIYSNAIAENFTATIDTTIMVYLYGTDDKGCVGVDSTLISLRPRTDMKFRVNPSCIDNDSRKVRFAGIVPEAEGTKWIWNVDLTKSDTVMGAIANYEYKGLLLDSIEVGVHAIDPYGCKFDSTAFIYKWHDFWAPEAFSPNGDGLNDRFVFRGGRFIDEFHVVIYDRLGAIVYEGDETDLIHNASDDIPTNQGWDGTCKGKPCPWGVYGYTVTYKSNENSVSKSGKKKGMITLMR